MQGYMDMLARADGPPLCNVIDAFGLSLKTERSAFWGYCKITDSNKGQ